MTLLIHPSSHFYSLLHMIELVLVLNIAEIPFAERSAINQSINQSINFKVMLMPMEKSSFNIFVDLYALRCR